MVWRHPWVVSTNAGGRRNAIPTPCLSPTVIALELYKGKPFIGGELAESTERRFTHQLFFHWQTRHSPLSLHSQRYKALKVLTPPTKIVFIFMRVTR